MMEKRYISWRDWKVPVYDVQTIAVGSGCAALNGADSLYELGQKDVALVTEGMKMGTSRNTGSDKQTYYKLSLASGVPDSVFDMARSLYNGQSVHGDTALVEAALSTRCFFKLVNLGVPFPFDRYGQYVGYKTDHDPMMRGTSCGPLTSKYMTECLEAAVRRKNIPVFNGYRIIELMAKGEGEERRILGAVAMSSHVKENPFGFALFKCRNILYGTGGPSGIYYNSVYPISQTCGHGAAFLCGAKGSNVTEWQYGIASRGFRWNLSGTYQQVIPRYVSTDENGEDEREFLEDYFKTPGEMLTAIFLKGYQWPFDPGKLAVGGSSLVDMAVYEETVIRGRKVYLDYTRNPRGAEKEGAFDFSLLSEEAREYLERSKALLGTPIQRLRKMNEPAYKLYLSHGIDLTRDRVEISVCAQHNNGGLKADMWWQSNIKGLFPVGEVCGNFGVYRPGGSALNATQAGSLRAAQYIAGNFGKEPEEEDVFRSEADKTLDRLGDLCRLLIEEGDGKEAPLTLRTKYQKEMDVCAGLIRKKEAVHRQRKRCMEYLDRFSESTLAKNFYQLRDAFINRDILITQLVYLGAMEQYMAEGGKSRGSYLVENCEDNEKMCLEQGLCVQLDNGERAGIVQEVWMEGRECKTENVKCRPLPEDNSWFEQVYNECLANRKNRTERQEK